MVSELALAKLANMLALERANCCIGSKAHDAQSWRPKHQANRRAAAMPARLKTRTGLPDRAQGQTAWYSIDWSDGRNGDAIAGRVTDGRFRSRRRSHSAVDPANRLPHGCFMLSSKNATTLAFMLAWKVFRSNCP